MKKIANGRIMHQDTDESKVIGIISAIILCFTVLTVFSYSDDNDTRQIHQNISIKELSTSIIPINAYNHDNFLISTQIFDNQISDDIKLVENNPI